MLSPISEPVISTLHRFLQVSKGPDIGKVRVLPQEIDMSTSRDWYDLKRSLQREGGKPGARKAADLE